MDKKRSVSLFLAAFFLTGHAQENPTARDLSEAFGHVLGKNLEMLGFDFDLNAIIKGLQDEAEGKPSPIAEEECMQTIAHLQEEKMRQIIEKMLQNEDIFSNGDTFAPENYLGTTPNSAERR